MIESRKALLTGRAFLFDSSFQLFYFSTIQLSPPLSRRSRVLCLMSGVWSEVRHGKFALIFSRRSVVRLCRLDFICEIAEVYCFFIGVDSRLPLFLLFTSVDALESGACL